MRLSWDLVRLLCLLFECLSPAVGGDELRAFRARLQANPLSPPVAAEGEPLHVFSGIYIESMSNFQAAQMSFDVDLYLYSNWRDPSLGHSQTARPVLINDPRVRERLWLPDLYFANAKTSKLHEVTAPNFNLFISADGQIASSTRVTLNVACNLDLTHYPMDRQKCTIRMLSYAYVASSVNITWFSRNPTRYNDDIELPEFRIVRITGEYCDGTYSYAIMEQQEQRDRFSCLEAAIWLERQIGYHLVQSFIPTALIVMVSWLSFWIDRGAAPARVTLSFTALLTLSTLGNGMRFGLPQVSYAKSIDFWFGACMLFVFLNLTEYAAVNSYLVVSLKYDRMANCLAKKVRNELRTHRSSLPEAMSPHKFSQNSHTRDEDILLLEQRFKGADEILEEEREERRLHKLARQYDAWSMGIDRWSRVVFPLAFLCWNTFYWGHYYFALW